MVPLLVLSLLGLLPDGPPPPPTVAGIRPPGVTVGSTAVWTIVGRDLLGAEAIVVEPPSGLHFEAIRVDPRGLTLAVTVRADPDAAPGVRTVRVDGPRGLSNPRLIQVDPLEQVLAVGRDGAVSPRVVAVGSAVAGTLRALACDRYRVEGTPGRRVALDWEARRLGVAIDPVLAASGPDGAPLGTARADPTLGGDARLALTVPPEGWLVAEVRDNTYRGGEHAHYRLRVVTDPPPDPSAPPDDPRLNGAEAITLGPGRFGGRGTLARPGEVDRLRVATRAGERLRVGCRAEPVGSPLDPVVTVRDPAGRVVAENDDAPPLPAVVPPTTADGLPPADARVDLTPSSDGPLTIEVADRSQGGGPEFGYNLELGPPRDDFALFLVPAESASGGAWNLRAGESVAVPLVIVPEGYPGTIAVRVEDLPPGVEVEPIVVRTAPPKRPGSRAAATAPWDAPPVVDALRLRVRPGAPPVRGSFRVLARRLAQADEAVPDRVAVLTVPLDAGIESARPVQHRITEFPVRVVAAPAP